MWVDFLSWHKCIRRNSGQWCYRRDHLFNSWIPFIHFFKFLETSSRKLVIYTTYIRWHYLHFASSCVKFSSIFLHIIYLFLHIIYFLFAKNLDGTDCEVAEESIFPSGWAFHKKAAFGCSFIHEELPQCRVARLTWQTFYTRCPSWHSSPRDLCTLLFLNQGFFFFTC